MATTERVKTPKSAASSKPERGSLYPPGHKPSDDPYYLDDTLDIHPPLRRLFPGKPTPEAMAAAKKLAAERGYQTPHFPPVSDDGGVGRGTAAEAPHSTSSNGAAADRLKRTAPPRQPNKK